METNWYKTIITLAQSQRAVSVSFMIVSLLKANAHNWEEIR